VTPEAALAATEGVIPCFEIVDSRIRDWKIRIQDTVADNASSGLFVLGDMVGTSGVDFVDCQITVEKNGKFLSQGRGSAALGSPLICVAWLANTLGRYGIPLKAGEVILSGSLVPLEPVSAGDEMKMSISGVGPAHVKFV
jgi:2-oxopent-4-enoate/cis-2-oxohex-4-enoate hydratase